MANNADNVSFGKPKVSGVFYTAPYGTALPTDATTVLPEEWKNNGYVSDDGITNSTDTDNSTIVEMGGATVLTEVTSYAESYQMTLIEILNADAAKTRYGDKNVTTDLKGGLTITHNLPDGKFSGVIELALNGNKADRIVIPNITRSEFGDRTLVGTDAMGYDVTLAANAYSAYDGGTSREYIASVATSSLGK
jgi:hypothetical protein